MTTRHDPTTAAVDEVMDRAAARGETLLSLCRIPFCLAVLVRFHTLGPPLPARIFNSAVIAISLGFSCFMLGRILRKRSLRGWLLRSILLDVTVAGLSLLQTLFWPSGDHSGYTGLSSHPDIAALPLVVFAAGLRLDVRAAALGLGCGLVWAAFLFALDFHLYGPMWRDGMHELGLFFALLAGAGFLAMAVAGRTRALAYAAGRATAQVRQAQDGYVGLLRDQHDARSLLTAAALHADLIERTLARPPANDPAPVELVRSLREDLHTASALVRALGERSFGQLVTLREAEAVSVSEITRDVLRLLGRRYPQLSLQLETAAPGLSARVVGGRVSFERILGNLIQNAAEGDGQRGATSVWVSTRAVDGNIRIEVRDDGPGFPPASLTAEAGTVSTKPHGLGLGLHGVAEILRQSGGSLSRSNLAAGGAAISILLPAADRTAPPAPEIVSLNG